MNPRTGPTSTVEAADAQHETEVVPATEVGNSVDPHGVGAQADHESHRRNQAVPEAEEETGHAAGGGVRLLGGRTGAEGESKAHNEDDGDRCGGRTGRRAHVIQPPGRIMSHRTADVVATEPESASSPLRGHALPRPRLSVRFFRAVVSEDVALVACRSSAARAGMGARGAMNPSTAGSELGCV